jgi:hypothetical protein
MTKKFQATYVQKSVPAEIWASFTYLLDTRIKLQYVLREGHYARCTFIYFSFVCVVTVSVDSVYALFMYY